MVVALDGEWMKSRGTRVVGWIFHPGGRKFGQQLMVISRLLLTCNNCLSTYRPTFSYTSEFTFLQASRKATRYHINICEMNQISYLLLDGWIFIHHGAVGQRRRRCLGLHYVYPRKCIYHVRFCNKWWQAVDSMYKKDQGFTRGYINT